MRAVKGSVVSSRSISLSKAAAILARFAGAETGARPEIVAYLRRASTAFDELVQFHREIKAVRRGTERDAPRKEEEDGSGGDGLKEEKKRSKKKKEKAGMEDGELRGEIGAVDGRDWMEDEGNSGGVGSELEEMKDAKSKKKKRRRKAQEEEKSNLDRKEEEVDEERHGKRRKKKKKKKDKGEREEEGFGDGLDGEGRDGDTKERRGLDHEIEWHRKKKKNKRKREIEKED